MTNFRATFSFICLLFVSQASAREVLSEEACLTGLGFLSAPYNACFTFTALTTSNTGRIAGLPSCWSPKYILGSVVTKSYNNDHVNYLLGDSQNIGYTSNPNIRMTWFNNDVNYTPVIDFGPRLVAVTNQGDGDNVISYHGLWRFVMIPLKSDNSFDIIPNGQNPGATDKICFNLIGYT